ncbi:unnamed protein product [Peronospora belbahrii]|uniref:HIT domain-containing protein n=1 Tax=Peronospora belbahrii TaxID=622444 RepID=A0AAU9KZG5_9STRA|nr:unnamed protein product [Peronospora belbahrii]CAH0518979.1 unnamed protein product [Peronospora belbahrii]
MKSIRICAFCCECFRRKNQIIYEDSLVLAIVDHMPKAKKHVLVIPHEHLSSVDSLTSAHTDLLEHMLITGKDILAKDGYIDKENREFGFHRSLFASIPHLHMHCFGLPFVPMWNRLRYTETIMPSYVRAENALAALRTK